MKLLKFSLAWIGGFSLIIATFAGCTKKIAVDHILNVDKKFSFPNGLPRDPGNEGKKTVEGIDSDQDGLRDDIQRWVYARYPNDEKKRKALRQMAIVYQDQLKKDFDTSDIDAFNQKENKAIACLGDVFPNVEDAKGNIEDMAYNELLYLKAKMLNTAERTARFLRNDAKFDGKALGPLYPHDGTACEK